MDKQLTEIYLRLGKNLPLVEKLLIEKRLLLQNSSQIQTSENDYPQMY